MTNMTGLLGEWDERGRRLEDEWKFGSSLQSKGFYDIVYTNHRGRGTVRLKTSMSVKTRTTVEGWSLRT